MINIDKIIHEAVTECGITQNASISSDEAIKLLTKSLEKIIYSHEFIEHLSEELAFKLR